MLNLVTDVVVAGVDYDEPVVDTYVPLTSSANISDDEPVNSKCVNIKDFAILADEWLNQLVWPMW
jgi:hypothetical protein